MILNLLFFLIIGIGLIFNFLNFLNVGFRYIIEYGNGDMVIIIDLIYYSNFSVIFWVFDYFVLGRYIVIMVVWNLFYVVV